jgi:hypothetical protein
MKNKLLIFALFILTLILAENSIFGQAFNATNIKRIAISEFENKSDYYDAGRYASDRLEYYLYNRSNFQIIERRMINKVLDELSLHQSGLFDPATVKKVGKMLGVDAIIVGTVSGYYHVKSELITDQITSRYDVTIKVIDVETGRILHINDWWYSSAENFFKDKTASQSEVARNKIDKCMDSLSYDFIAQKRPKDNQGSKDVLTRMFAGCCCIFLVVLLIGNM